MEKRTKSDLKFVFILALVLLVAMICVGQLMIIHNLRVQVVDLQAEVAEIESLRLAKITLIKESNDHFKMFSDADLLRQMREAALEECVARLR